MTLKAAFRMPKPVKITGRSSSITNSFVNSIIPVIDPAESQIARALDILEMDQSNVVCAYCGDKFTEWDHLNPLVLDKQPTGFITEIENLVPACGKCNQSKGNKPWRDWILSSAVLSPKSRGISDIERRMRLLGSYEVNNQTTRYDFRRIVGDDIWEAYWQDWQKVQDAMKDAQVLADDIRSSILKASAK